MSILFITSNPLGDAILSTGAIRWLSEKFPGEGIVVACGPAAAGLFQAMPEVEAVWPMPKLPRGGHWRNLWLRASRRRWRYVLDLRGSAFAYTVLARGRKVPPPPDSRPRHRVEHLTEALGAAAPLAPRICWSGADMADAEQRLGGFGARLLVVGPTAKWAGKAWPAHLYAELLRILTGPGGLLEGAKVAVPGAPGEEAMAMPVLDALPAGQAVPVFGWPIVSVAAMLSRAALYVGNDTGLMHLAAAAGAPTLGLFGPSRPEHYAPWGPKAAYLRSPVSYEEMAATPGFPDFRRGSMLADIPVAAVVQAAADLLHKQEAFCGKTS